MGCLWPMTQAAASAYFALHLAGLEGQLLALMIGADNVARHLRVEGDGLAQVCAKPNTTAGQCAPAVPRPERADRDDVHPQVLA
jgi:hypothetical protein